MLIRDVKENTVEEQVKKKTKRKLKITCGLKKEGSYKTLERVVWVDRVNLMECMGQYEVDRSTQIQNLEYIKRQNTYK